MNDETKKLTKGKTRRARLSPGSAAGATSRDPGDVAHDHSDTSAPGDVKEDTRKGESDRHGAKPTDLDETVRGRSATDLSVSCDEEVAQEEDGTYRLFLHSINTGEPFTLPLADHVVSAIRHNRDVFEDGDRQDELKQSKGADGYRSALFEFTRSVKSHPEMAAVDAEDALDLVHDILRGHVDPDDPWGEFYDLSDDVATEDDAKAEFMDVWDRITHPRCADPLTKALARARECPVTVPNVPKLNVLPTGRLFLAVAAHLQLGRPGQTIKLPCERLGRELGVSAMTISRYRRTATEARVIREPKRRTRKRNQSGDVVEDATEFVFDLTRCEPSEPGDPHGAAPAEVDTLDDGIPY
jgi:hypothetical protein